MKDRVPRYPGRIKLVPSDAGDDLFVLTRDDDPQQVGTPLNKASLLSDATASLMDLQQEDPTVDDALASIGGRFTMIRGGTSAPGLDTTAKKGDIYILASGAKPRVYVCDAVGVQPVSLDAEWERGGITTGGVSSAVNYRVRSQVVDIPAGTVLSIASGFRFALYRFNDAGEYVSVVSFRTSAYTVSSGMRFRILIARVTENTSETADVAEFSAALYSVSTGAHWSLMAAAREVRKTAILTSSQYWTVPADLRGDVTVRVFGGGAGGCVSGETDMYGKPVNSGYGGGGGHMALWTGPLTARRYEVIVGKGGDAGSDGGASSFGSLVSAAGGSGSSGGSGGGGGTLDSGLASPGNGSYGGGGGGCNTGGANGGTYGGGGGGGGRFTGGSNVGYAGGSGRSGQYTGGRANGEYGGGGGGYSANGGAATASAGGTGGKGANTVGFGLEFEGSGAGGSLAGGGGGYGGPGGAGYFNGARSQGGGGGGYGAKGGAASTQSGGGGGGFGGPGGDGNGPAGGGGGGYGLSGRGGTAGTDSGGKGGIAAGGAAGYAGGDGVVIVYYTGVEVY